MRTLAVDTEVTTSNTGNPFDATNRLVCFSTCLDGQPGVALQASESNLRKLQDLIDSADLLVFFNAKFDLHWLRRVGINTTHKPVWCCQLAEFLLEQQAQKYPSLEGMAVKYGLGNKIDVIKTEYWDKGINTDQIPWPVLEEYAKQDAELTYAGWSKQVPQFSGNLYKLFRLQCADLRVLEEMEWNGLVYDPELCKQKEQEISDAIQKINEELSSVYPDVPINFSSNKQLSAFLFGGTISVTEKEHVGFYKSGAKAGQPKYRNVVVEHSLPRLYEPVGSPLASGDYSTAEDTLLKLRGKKTIVKKLLELSKLEKLRGTYYQGYPKLNAEMNWPPGELHGQYNQVVARTGRISSTKPNLQNIAGEVQSIFVTRFK